ncbi:MAG: hypothetical protein ACREAB_01485 [Blastocatellia bacterium]
MKTSKATTTLCAMDKTRTPNNRRGLSATMTVAKPYTREERDFIRAFASALNHATAVIAAEPELSVSAGSIAQLVQRAYSRFRPDQRPAIQQRARARLSGPSEQRQRYFGAYADRGAEAWTDAEPGLDRELKRLLHEALSARLEFQRQEIAESLAVGAAAEYFPGPILPQSKTTLEIGFFSAGEEATWTSQTISSPISIELRWKTNAPGAERGVWQLFQSGQSGQQEVLLASGKAGKAPGAVFSIDLGEYLPPNPPAAPAVYLIRVTPGTAPKVAQGSTPSQTGKVPGKAVGPPSNDVVIKYSATVEPGVEFQVFEIYQTARFVLEEIHMIEDQIGGGAEEFHVAGFVQENFPAGSVQAGGQQKFGPFFAKLDPDGPRTMSLSHSSSYFLNKPDSPEWPRAYITVISVLEEDDGGSFEEWKSSVWDIAQEALSGAVSQITRDLLEEKFKEFVGDNIGQIIQTGGQIAQTIASLISGVTGAIAGLVVAAASLVIADIISGMADDYYGTGVFVFVLPTNITDFVNSLPGQAIGGGFQLDTEGLLFKGPASWPEATAWDGMVDVTFHWEFTNKFQA